MGLFSFLTSPDFHELLEEYKNTPGAVLLDVRNPSEYAGGHVPGSRNLPLPTIESAPSILPNKETPVYVYCLSGGRSRQAADALKKMGYETVTNLGGITSYNGPVER